MCLYSLLKRVEAAEDYGMLQTKRRRRILPFNIQYWGLRKSLVKC